MSISVYTELKQHVTSISRAPIEYLTQILAGLYNVIIRDHIRNKQFH
jgi:hypothetical protein